MAKEKRALVQPVDKERTHLVIWTEKHGVKGTTDDDGRGMAFCLESAGEKGKVYRMRTRITYEEVTL